jgi:hypothetical protein
MIKSVSSVRSNSRTSAEAGQGKPKVSTKFFGTRPRQSVTAEIPISNAHMTPQWSLKMTDTTRTGFWSEELRLASVGVLHFDISE